MKHFIQQLKVCLLFSILIFITTALSQPKMYWTEQISDPKIRRANLDGSNIEDLLTVANGLFRPSGIALDSDGGKMYWTDISAQKLQRADLDGNNIEDLLTGTSGPLEIALDVNNGKMYWINFFSIHRADLDGSNEETLVNTGNVTSFGIALDLNDGKMYWTIGGTVHKIERANLDGSGRETILNGIGDPRGIALDLQGGKMYWTETGIDPFIMRANLDGSNIESLVGNNPTPVLESPLGITLDLVGGKMYWTDFLAEKIQRADLDGSNVEEMIASGILDPGYISILSAPNAVDDDVVTIPDKYVLKQNFPNPFNPSTTIKFSIPSESFTTLKVYDVLGNEIEELVNEQLPAGNYKFNFAANTLSSGIYFYRITSGSFTAVKKMTLLK